MYFANNPFQKGQEVEVAEIAPNKEQEIVHPKIPEISPKQRKKNWCNVQCETNIK